MSDATNEIILITRADDMGYTHTGNLAILGVYAQRHHPVRRHIGGFAVV